eukprot:m.264499 g.264499  ORF g.264499 m.264499 type:complete len:176 (+) comp26724_c0_seq4:4274-4801(+)
MHRSPGVDATTIALIVVAGATVGVQGMGFANGYVGAASPAVRFNQRRSKHGDGGWICPGQHWVGIALSFLSDDHRIVPAQSRHRSTRMNTVTVRLACMKSGRQKERERERARTVWQGRRSQAYSSSQSPAINASAASAPSPYKSNSGPTSQSVVLASESRRECSSWKYSISADEA